MDFKKIIDILSSSNIDNNKIYELVAKASTMDLTDEANQRTLIREGALVANKNLTSEAEDKIIDLIKEKGISADLFSFLK